MAKDKDSNVVLNFKMSGQVEYAKTIKDINAVMNAAASEYKTHVAAMGKDADQTKKLAAEKKKLEIQLEGGRERTKKLREEYQAMAKDTNTSVTALANKYKQLQNSEQGEIALENALEKVNEGLSEQAIESRKAEEALNKLEGESGKLETQTSKLNAEYDLQVAQLGNNADESDKLKLKMEHLNNTHEVAGEKVKNYEEQLEQAKLQYGENSSEVEKYEKKLIIAQTQEQRLANEIDSTNTALEAQQKEAENTGKKFDEMGEKIKDVGSKMKDVGDGMTDAGARMTAGVTAPILGIAAASKSAWEEVDDGLDTIVSKTGATGDALASLEKSFENVATTTKFDFQQVGDSIGEVNTQFGVMGDDLDAASIKMLKFAEISEADVATSAIKSKQAMSLFGLEAKDLDMALDSIAKTAQNTGQSTDKLMDAVVKGGPQLTGLGLNFAQSVELMGQFEQAGVDSTKAMSYMSRATVSFAKDGKTLEQGMKETIKSIEGAKSETEALTIASEVFGTKGASVMVDAIKRGTMNFDEFADASKDATGSVESTFEGMRDPIDDVSIATNNLKYAAGDLFGQLQEMLVPILTKVIEVVQKGVKWFTGLDDGMKKTIIVVLGVAAAIGPLLVWAGLLISSIGSMVTGFGAIMPVVSKLIPIIGGLGKSLMLLAMNPVVLTILAIVAAVAALVAIGVLVYKNWDSISKWFVDMWGYLKTGAVAVFEFLMDFFAKWGKTILIVLGGPVVWLVALFVKYFDEIKATIIAALNFVLGFFEDIFYKVWNVVYDFLTWFDEITQGKLSEITDFFKRSLNGISEIFDGAMQLIKDTVKNALAFLKALFTGDFGKMKEIVTNQFNSIKEFISTVWLNIKGRISDTLDTIKTVVSNVFGSVKDTATKVWEGIYTAIKTPIDKAKDAVKKAIDTIKALFNFKFKWPDLKMPKFSIEGSMNPVKWISEGVPKLKVKWNAQGGIFTQPTIFGASGGQMQGAGEAGPEAVLPLNQKTLGDIGKGIAAAMSLNNTKTSGNHQVNITLDIDGATLARKTVLYNSRELYKLTDQRQTGAGIRGI